MSYGDARYQTKRISIGSVKASDGTPSEASDPAEPLESTDSSISTAYLQEGPIPAKPVTVNPYTAPRKIRTFTEPLPDSDPLPPAPEFTTSLSETTPQATNAHHFGATRIYELAEKYVDVFQAHATAQMTSEQRQAMIVEVATFYSAPFRAGRLEALVSAFDV